MRVRLDAVAPAVGLRVRAGTLGGADRLAAAPAVVRSMATIVGGWAAADFPADEACVRRQWVPVRAALWGSFRRPHTLRFAHLFDGW
ncbi:hypothetical protein ACU5JM_09340 [Rhodococcus erythropolis]|uniref:hypothetical protein n=1 Tax=Rhodococcus erythropolis TaxID=1833 RepID=UPI00406BC72D